LPIPHITLPLVITEDDGIGRIDEPVSVGVPLPKGHVFDPAVLTLYDTNDAPLPLQSEVLARWSDGSIQWTLADFLASVAPHTTVTYTLKDGGGAVTATPGGLLTVHETAAALVVETGVACFWLDPTVLLPFQQVAVQGDRVLEEPGSCIVLQDAEGQAYQPSISQYTLEATGPVRATLCLRGVFQGEMQAILARFVARMSFYAGSGLVELRFTVHNPRAATHPGGLWDLGDVGSIYFRDLALHLLLQGHGRITQEWTSHPCQPLMMNADTHLEIYQDSSGGQNWYSTNHVNRNGQVMQTFPGYRVTADNRLIAEGNRATPMIAVSNDETRVVATIDQFWQNFPKALEANCNTLTLRVFPQQYRDVYELQGGEQKTHTVWLQFTRQHDPMPDVRWWHCRLQPRSTPEWYTHSQAISYLIPKSANKHTDYHVLVDTAIEGNNTFFDRREIIDEYGWRHFGDLYADHEAVGHQGEMPLVSHYNNQYDAIYGAVVQYVSSGEPRWWTLMTDLAKHVIDIDIYRTNDDRPAYNYGLFWHTDHYTDVATATHRAYSQATRRTRGLQDYGGGPSNEHNYTTGLLYYYYLTGDPLARETVVGLANWVINMDDGSHRPLGRWDRRPTGFCSTTSSQDYHGPGRGAGNSINALLDACLLTGEPHYLAKAEELIRRCIHPNDDIEQRQLDDVEHRWSYTVFLQSLGKYLDCKVERQEIDYMYSYARASLLHYACWMVEHEVPYKLVLDRVAIPTETWPAQDIRKSTVFKFAAKYAHEPLRSAFLRKADDFFQACLLDLQSFETCTLTRPIVLLLAHGCMQAYFEHYPTETAPLPHEIYNFGEPQAFTPQLYEVYMIRDRVRTLVHRIRAAMRRLDGKRQVPPHTTGEDHG
jgi:hypothetical protein